MLRPVLTRVLRGSTVLRSESPLPVLASASASVWASLFALLFALACSDHETQPPPSPTPAKSAVTARAEATPSSQEQKNPNVQKVASRGSERPLPAFEGRTFDGDRLSISSLIGKRLVIFFFNPEVASAETVSLAVSSVAAQRAEFNFNVLGIAIGSNPVKSQEFIEKLGFDFPVIDDSRGRITGKLGLRAPVMLLSVDPEGFLGELAMGAFTTDSPDASETIANQIREKLRIPSTTANASIAALDRRQIAPTFVTPRLAGGDPFDLASLAGKPLVLIFFLHTCPHCHAALHFLQEELGKIPADNRPALVAVSISNRGSNAVVGAALRGEKIDVDELILLADPAGDLASLYGVFGGVPVVNLIDGSGRIVQRIQGWEGGRETALLRMQLAKIAGVRVPMLLNPKGYTGADACGVCHVDEYNSWTFTRHASAYDTLVTHGQQRDGECVSCHVAGFGQPGGFTLAEKPHHLEDVSCENCHGRGGPHLSPEFVKNDNYETACLVCHNKEHSLGFEYASFLPKISHRAIAALDETERALMLASQGKPRDVLPQAADHVGSNTCRSCHAGEFATWSQSGHAHAGKTLTQAGKASIAECLACHTTGFERAGGFPASATRIA